MIRSAILAFSLLATLSQAQDADEKPEKVSNDRPDRPLQMPPAASETKEAFDDFERFARRGAWERATKALYAIPEAQSSRFVDGQDGFIIPVSRKRRAVLSALSPEGQAAYRLFYDSDAKKLFDDAAGPKEQETLEKLYSSYFLTSVGDNAADRLGDLYFEQGHYDRAADCWLSILRDRSDSELSPGLLTVKAGMALARADRRSELATLKAELTDRYADEVVAIGGRKAMVAEHLRDLTSGSGPAKASVSASASNDAAPVLSTSVAPTWQMRFGASITAGMTPVELSQWEATNFAGAVPPVAIEQQTLFVNYLGHIFAIDLVSGKMLWRSASFHNVEQSTAQGQSQMIDPKKFAILAAPGFVWTLGRDIKDMNYMAVSNLVCRRAENGEVVWQSPNLPDYAGIDLVGTPILVNGTIYVAGKSGTSNNYYGSGTPPHQYLLAVQAHDGKVLWKTEVGMFREFQRYYYYGMGDNSPQPRLAYRAGSVYIDTHQGVLARVGAESGQIEWGYGYPTESVQSGYGRMIFFINGMPSQSGSSQSAAGVPLLAGDAILIKGAKADRICAIDPDRMKVLWERPIAKSARLLGIDDSTIYLGGPELAAMDIKTRTLRWSTPLPSGSEEGSVLVRSEGLWQLTPRGIFEVDPKSGAVRRIFRGNDAGSAGGDLLLTDRWLLTISNRTISAYPRGSTGAARAAGGDAATKTGGAND